MSHSARTPVRQRAGAFTPTTHAFARVQISGSGSECTSLGYLGKGRNIVLKGFRDFILRGNVIDLAVAVVIGAAFAAIVTALVNNIIN